jgi:glyoxylase-like metal-dependent hydrolase (beta-lactamase superfamily II)
MPLRVADRWFERESADDGITRLWEPHVHPLLRCNVYHVRGRDRDLVVDTGAGVASVRDEIADLVDKPVLALATHIHWDHVGGLHEFDDRCMHRIEASRMNPYDEFATLRRDDFPQFVLDALAADGYAIEGEHLIDALPHAGYEVADYAIVPVSPTRELEEGDAIDLGDRRFEVMHLPGHSPGSTGLFEERTRTLFSGDAIYDGPLIDDLPDSCISDYVDTMKRLRDCPAVVVHGGHEPSFDGARLVEIADHYLARRG